MAGRARSGFRRFAFDCDGPDVPMRFFYRRLSDTQKMLLLAVIALFVIFCMAWNFKLYGQCVREHGWIWCGQWFELWVWGLA